MEEVKKVKISLNNPNSKIKIKISNWIILILKNKNHIKKKIN